MGYLSASIRSVADARVGDTITHSRRKAEISLPGYEEVTPMVFCGLFPVDADQYKLCAFHMISTWIETSIGIRFQPPLIFDI